MFEEHQIYRDVPLLLLDCYTDLTCMKYMQKYPFNPLQITNPYSVLEDFIFLSLGDGKLN